MTALSAPRRPAALRAEPPVQADGRPLIVRIAAQPHHRFDRFALSDAALDAMRGQSVPLTDDSGTVKVGRATIQRAALESGELVLTLTVEAAPNAPAGYLDALRAETAWRIQPTADGPAASGTMLGVRVDALWPGPPAPECVCGRPTRRLPTGQAVHDDDDSALHAVHARHTIRNGSASTFRVNPADGSLTLEATERPPASMGGEDTLPTPLGRMSDAVTVAQALRAHDATRMSCSDHDGKCCPAPGCAHGFRDAALHQALALLADPKLRDAMVRAAMEHDATRTLSGPDLHITTPPRRGW